MQEISSTILFAGPSLTDKARTLIEKKGVELRAPVQRNDIYKILKTGFRENIVIADGVFHQVIAVGHAEIRTAIEQGCKVYGLSSMGAIRAYEMRHLGMVGFGQVYNWFFQMEDFQDDELALFHFPAPSFKPITEPMVHFRACVKSLVENDIIKDSLAKFIIDELKSKYYSDRTLKKFEELLKNHNVYNFNNIIENFDQHRIKSLDLIQFLEEEVWRKNVL